MSILDRDGKREGDYLTIPFKLRPRSVDSRTMKMRVKDSDSAAHWSLGMCVNVVRPVLAYQYKMPCNTKVGFPAFTRCQLHIHMSMIREHEASALCDFGSHPIYV